MRQREAVESGNTVEVNELALFRKDVGTYIKQYDFLSQLFDYEDPWLEKLSIYVKHLAAQLTDNETQAPIDLSTVQLDYLGRHQRDTVDSKPDANTELPTPNAGGTGVARDSEMVALSEIIDKINDLFSGDHSEASVRNVVTDVRDKLEESEILKQQAQVDSLSQFSASPDLHNEFVRAVIGAMECQRTCLHRFSTTPTWPKNSLVNCYLASTAATTRQLKARLLLGRHAKSRKCLPQLA